MTRIQTILLLVSLLILGRVAGATERLEGGTDAGADTDRSDAGQDGDLGPDGSADVLTAEDALERPAFLWDPLPPVAPDPDLSPVMEPSARVTAPVPLSPRERPRALVRAILGLVALLALAYAAGHPRVQRLEERLGVSQVITAGFPFVLLGFVARRPEVGVLNDDMLAELSPVLRLGLGWIGFMVGFRLDVRLFDRLPSRAIVVAGLLTALPFAAVVTASGLLLVAASRLPENLKDPVFLRDAIILGTAAVTTAQTALRLLPSGSVGGEGGRLVARIIRLEEVAGILGLAAVAAYFRAPATWQIPGAAWLFLTLGLGMGMGLVAYALLRRATTRSELLVVALGTIMFAAGFAGNIRLSPVVVCFVMGLLVANAPGGFKTDLGQTLLRLERPLYFLFLLIVGALWRPGDWHGWALMVLFVVARLGGKLGGIWLGSRGGALALTTEQRRALAIAPMGPLALAIVINAQLLYPGGAISQIVTAIVGGAIITEILVQLANRRWAAPASVSLPPRPMS